MIIFGYGLDVCHDVDARFWLFADSALCWSGRFELEWGLSNCRWKYVQKFKK